MAKVRHIALVCPVGEPHFAQMLRGVTEYAKQQKSWTVNFSPEMYTSSVRGLKGWPGHGVIATLLTKAGVRTARTLRIPVVNTSGALRRTGLPRVMLDQEAVGRLAAEHLLERNFRRFAYYGMREAWFSQQRRRGFIERIARDGGEYSTLEAPGTPGTWQTWTSWMEPLEEWLDTLKPPVGLMAAHDYRASMVINACVRLGLDVPNDVAVIGVDNDESVCAACYSPLSSISHNDWTLGYEAAALLDRLMRGRRPPKRDILIPPGGVTQRRSTHIVAAEDSHVASAVHFIREHIGESFGVERLERILPISRRWLERRFKQCLNCTPHEYICQTRVERAQKLLTTPEKLPLWQIAESCGFSDTRNFRQVFQRITGKMPAEYRRSELRSL